MHAAQHGEEAAGQAGSKQTSTAAPNLSVPGAKEPEPDPDQLAAGQTIPAVQMQRLLASAAAEQNLPAPAESVPVAAGDVEPTRMSSAHLPLQPSSVALPPGGQVSEGLEKIPPVELAAGLGLPGLSVAPGAADQPNLQAATAAGKVEAEVDGEPATQRQAVRVATQPSAELPIVAGNASAVDVELARQPAVPVIEERAAHQPGGRADASPGKGALAATVMRPENVPPDREEPGQIVKQPVLARHPAGIDVKPDAGSAEGAPAQPGTPPPAELPPASTDHTDLSGRRATRPQASAPSSRRSSGSVVAEVLALSGQMQRTVDSISPVESAPRPVGTAAGTAPPQATPVKATPNSLAESLVPAEDTGVRELAASTPDRGELAFAMRMKAMPGSEEAVQRESPVGLPAAEGSRRISVAKQQGEDVPAPEPATASEKRPSLSAAPDPAPARAGRDRHPEVAPVERTETPTDTLAGKMIPHAGPEAQVKAGTAPERPDTAAAKPAQPQDTLESESKPESAKATSVRDMKFEVTGGERRVEVRLSERGGEMKMTVRTADAPLASTLRENLPALSARLAESGFKSEAWHPAASSPDQWRHTAESSAGGASHDTNQDANAHPDQQDRESQDGAGQRRQKSPQEVAPQKEKGRDFAWLMSSLR